MTDYRLEAPQIVRDFLRFLKMSKNSSDKTIEEYYLDLRTFLRFMKMERAAIPGGTAFEDILINDIDLSFIGAISKVDINSFVDYLRSDRVANAGQSNEHVGLAATSTQRKVACIKSFYAYLCEATEQLQRNPSIGVVTPAIRKKLPVYLTLDESKRLLSAVSGLNETRDYAILVVFLNCGLRVSEIVGINLPDLRRDEDSCFLNIRGKGGKARQVFLSDAVLNAIDDYLAIRDGVHAFKGHESALFLSRHHKRMSVSAVQVMVKNATLAAGLVAYSPHKLRHTAATLMHQNGVDVRTLQELLGHQSLNTTQIYTHINSDDLRTAARANPLSRARRRPQQSIASNTLHNTGKHGTLLVKDKNEEEDEAE